MASFDRPRRTDGVNECLSADWAAFDQGQRRAFRQSVLNAGTRSGGPEQKPEQAARQMEAPLPPDTAG